MAQQNLNIRMDDDISKGVHGTDVMLSINDKDVSLTFFVYQNQSIGEAIATARVFIPHTTAVQLAGLLQKQLEPSYKMYEDMMKKLPPSSGSTSEHDKKDT